MSSSPASPPTRPLPVLEAIPNFSEGRREAVLERLRAAAGGYPGVFLLDASRDADHHRAVLTLAGDRQALLEALLALYRVAVEEIDLTCHRGIHPRIGAVDVVPFVPLGETPMAEAVEAARELGRRVAERFRIPVLLYGEAATAPHRVPLADLRRGGFEALEGRLLEPPWRPDFGPSRPHPACGASAVGARFFLVACNAWLDAADPAVARAVARAVRESSGGLPAVRALGLPLASHGLSQVSMNLVDYRITPPAVAFSAVAREAEARGARVVRRELIGLLPEAALAAGADAEPEEARRLRESWQDRTLEARLREAR